MLKDQIYCAHGTVFSVHCFMTEDFGQTDKLSEAHIVNPLVKNQEFGGWSNVSECTPLKTLGQEPITNEMVINRTAKKNQTAANDLILKQARLELCFNEYHDCAEYKKSILGFENKSFIFQRARNKALQNILWV